MKTEPKALRIELEVGSVASLLLLPTSASACYVFAHGAGAGMQHHDMEAVASGLADRGIATLRYQFPYMEAGARRPDPPAVAHAAVRAAVAKAVELAGLPVIAGGKSFGGRMTSLAQSQAPMDGVRGLAFLGFPLHPAGKPSSERATHLADVMVPMLFVQGTRDKLAEWPRIELVVEELGARATLFRIEHADHGFDVLVRSGRKPVEVMSEVLDGLAKWIRTQAV